MTIKRCYPVLVGASVAENQLIQNGDFENNSGWTIGSTPPTVSDGIASYTSPSDGAYSLTLARSISSVEGHKVLVLADVWCSAANAYRIRYPFLSSPVDVSANTWTSLGILGVVGSNTSKFGLQCNAITNVNYQWKNIMFIDMTLWLGSAIADYVYSLGENALEWLRSYGFITDEYKPYNTGTIESVEATAKVVRDENGENAVTYPLGNDVLRGIFKLDANNQLYADGDRKEADGTITRYYGTRDHQEGDESLADAITDGTTTVYKLTTPTTEQSTPFTSPQIVYPDGTEEFVTGNGVPVGHETSYQL